MLAALTHHLKLPDLWQHEAVNHLRGGSDVIVSAPTGAGKTYIFELLIQAGTFKRQVVYTVPTRALANDKYAEWKDAGWNVGLATGDLSENVRAPVLVATLETQIERLLINDGPELLVMDEFQMIADPSRGSHYEGAIVLAPPDTRLLLLSGSVENSKDVAEWMRRIGRRVEVVSTAVRPVPLEDMPIEVMPQKKGGIEGWWPRLATSVLMNDLAPLLIFAPRRKDAESIAHKLATNLPQGEPLHLTPEQRTLAGKDFAALLEKRIAYHHSGLAYALRAGLVEPLAKAGQLRVIVSTMGLAAGINFSVRSVHVSSTSFHDGVSEQQLTPDELLQMFGRAGRRGLDERGYVITTRESPMLADSRPARLRRSSKLSWPLFLRVMRRAALDGLDPFEAAKDFALKLFAKTPPELGLDEQSGFTLGGAAATALFGLKGTKRELRNSIGQWEELHANPKQQVSLAEAWRSHDNYPGPALGEQRFVQSLANGLGRLCKLTKREGVQLYGKEIALGVPSSEESQGLKTITSTLRKLLQIPKHIESLGTEKVQKVLLPKLLPHFAGANLLGLIEKEALLWAQFDFSPKLVDTTRDSLGQWIMDAEERIVERITETEIKSGAGTLAKSARSGTPVHAWRELGLIESDGAPTQRGVIFSFFQHGEGLAIAATLEDESYPVEDIVLHLANLRSDCRHDIPINGGSERLSAVCRATYGFVNYHGYLESGLPLGYGEGTAELLGLVIPQSQSTPDRTLLSSIPVAEGDLARARIEWLSLLRHITHAPDHDWNRWRALRAEAARVLELHLAQAKGTLHAKLPPLTPKQRHERPRHAFFRGRV
jgi:superfamily II DNA/RNA helicase